MQRQYNRTMSCPQCIEGGILPGSPKGETLEDGAYFAAAPLPSNETKTKAIIILTDVFGLGIPNPKILADNYAAQLNLDVYVPDIFAGTPMIPDGILTFPNVAGFKRSFWDWIIIFFKMIPIVPRFIAGRKSVVDPRVRVWIKKIREEKGYTRLGGIGYCYGGALGIRLGQPGLLETCLVNHPGPFTKEELNACTIPLGFACAEDDPFFNEKCRDETEANLASRNIENEFKIYPGTTHGYAARPIDIPQVKEAYEKTIEQSMNWLRKML